MNGDTLRTDEVYTGSAALDYVHEWAANVRPFAAVEIALVECTLLLACASIGLTGWGLEGCVKGCFVAAIIPCFGDGHRFRWALVAYCALYTGIVVGVLVHAPVTFAPQAIAIGYALLLGMCAARRAMPKQEQ